MADESAERLLPEEPVDRFVYPIARFLHVEASGGVVLVAATVSALVLANSALADAWLALWQTKLTVGLGSFQMSHSLKHWISDGLMAVFFFVIGLEVKRELVLGELRELRKAALPVAAALGGMVVPAGLYLALQAGEPGARGWGIPMATDIAFVVGIMAVLGPRVPPALRVLLLSLAIADDLGAILVIAIGYTEQIDGRWLLFGAAAMGLVRLMALAGVRAVSLYVVSGAAVWLGFHESGVHATIAGVLLGLLTPAKSWVSDSLLRRIVERADRYLHGEVAPSPAGRRAALREVGKAVRETLSPLERLENALHPWQSFAIVPLFALVNAGVVLEPSLLGDPVAVAVAVGLALGKPAGILAASWLAVRLGLASLPEGVGWGALLGGGALCGIGFTMALFIAELALGPALLPAAKVGILAGSLVSGAVGVALLLWWLPRPAPAR